MKAVLATGYGLPEDGVLAVGEIEKPALFPGGGQLLVKVFAVSLSPGDVRTIAGHVDWLRKKTFPWVPGGDLAGVVVGVDAAAPGGFQVGDRLVATFEDRPGPRGALAEYHVVNPLRAAKLPPGVSAVDGSALVGSACHALIALRNAGDVTGLRVLVLGGSGGVGTSLIQFLKAAGAGFIAATSTQADLVASLGADVVVDYIATDPFRHQPFLDSPFDVCFDCAGDGSWEACKRSGLVKVASNGGRFIGIGIDDPWLEVHNIFDVLPIVCRIMGRIVFLNLCGRRSVPHYSVKDGWPGPLDVAEVVAAVADGTHRVVLDAAGPFSFTTEGVTSALALVYSRHAHGKVVVRVAEE